MTGYICGKRSSKQLAKDTYHNKIRDHCHLTDKYKGAAYSICNLRFNMTNEILIVFHNGSKYDYHFIIKELTN